MRARDPNEQGRAATPLELFFDLVVVVAVALAAERLHDGILTGLEADTLVSYVLVFFGVWWAWVNFTWFASAYDTDDVVYRLSVLGVMTGALVLAAGVPPVFDDRDFTLAVVGYVIMRIALVTQWIRVIVDEPLQRRSATRRALGVTLCQVGWLSLLLPFTPWALVWIVLVPAELAVPYLAQRNQGMRWHPEHVTERYGLFMIIVLGESVLAASIAIQNVTDGAGLTAELAGVIAGSLLIVYAMWWIYFDRPQEHLLESVPSALAWSYLHLPIFAAVAAVGAGLVVAIEEAAGHAHLGWTEAGLTVAVPLAVYLVSLRLLYLGSLRGWFHQWSVPVTAVFVLAAVFTPAPLLVTGLLMTALVAVKVVLRVRDHSLAEAALPVDHP
jgi:low temperature requirement protein LtrA